MWRCLFLLSVLFWPTQSLAQGSGSWAARAVGQTLAAVARDATPAVVHVQVQKGPSLSPELQEVLQDYELSLDESVEGVRSASGSGVIVSPQGRVVTNHHVVEGAVELHLVLADQRRVPAHIVGADPRTDVAILQIDAAGPFPWAPLGDSDALQVGDLVMAIGSPFDFLSSVTVGIVSAKGRRGLAAREIQDYIQTDAAVNPGNSGGPLLSIDGHVVGINTAIFSQGAEQNSGISFAIPSNMAARIARDLEALGRVRRSRVGLLCRSVDEVDGDSFRSGVEVVWVTPDGPAERAGLRRGDVVLSVDDEPVTTTGALRNLVLAREVGAPLTFRVSRDEQQSELLVHTMAEEEVGVGPDQVPEAITIWSGLVLAEPDDRLRGYFGVGVERGVLVVRVEPDSPGAAMGLTAGDLLTEVSSRAVYDLVSLEQALVRRDEGQVVVTFQRGGGDSWTILPAGGAVTQRPRP